LVMNAATVHRGGLLTGQYMLSARARLTTTWETLDGEE
jgi:hypothetical protein